LHIQITIVTLGWIQAVKKKLFCKEPLRSVPVNDDPSHRVDPVYRGALIETPRRGVATLYDLAKDSFSRYGSRTCMMSRVFLGWRVPDKVKEFSETLKCLSFADIGLKSHKFGAALRSVGMKAASSTTDLNQCTEPCRLAIFENTCAEWMIAAIGAFTQSMTVVTVYATLGLDSVVEAINDNAVPLLVCNQKDLSRLVEKCSEMPSLTTIVYTTDMVAPDVKTPWMNVPKDIKIIDFEDFCESGNTQAYPPAAPTADTCAVVMYTSGSTGKPKGVVITHRQIVATCAAAEVAFGIRRGQDVYLAYLPLAHIMELMAEFVMVSQGCTLCYAEPRSLTTAGAYPMGALEQYSPTLMVAVPKIWDTIKKGIEAKVAAGHPIVALLIQTAFEWRGFALKHGFDTPLFKVLVFNQLAKAAGGKLRCVLCCRMRKQLS
jgi:long-chain acyl-CoA synthetase